MTTYLDTCGSRYFLLGSRSKTELETQWSELSPSFLRTSGRKLWPSCCSMSHENVQRSTRKKKASSLNASAIESRWCLCCTGWPCQVPVTVVDAVDVDWAVVESLVVDVAVPVTVCDFVVDAVAVDWAVVESLVVEVAVPVTVWAFVVDAVAVE